MQRKTIQHLVAVSIFIAVSVLIYFLMNSWLAAIVVFGVLIFGYSNIEPYADYCRMRTLGFFANIGIRGHSSIKIDEDMIDLPPIRNSKIIYKAMRPGGSTYGYPFRGSGPLFICPSDYVKKFDGAIIAIANWNRVNMDHLPLRWQQILYHHFGWNLDSNTKIFYAETSPINEQLKADMTIDFEREKMLMEREINTLISQNDDLNKVARTSISLASKYARFFDESDVEELRKLMKKT